MHDLGDQPEDRIIIGGGFVDPISGIPLMVNTVSDVSLLDAALLAPPSVDGAVLLVDFGLPAKTSITTNATIRASARGPASRRTGLRHAGAGAGAEHVEPARCRASVSRGSAADTDDALIVVGGAGAAAQQVRIGRVAPRAHYEPSSSRQSSTGCAAP